MKERTRYTVSGITGIEDFGPTLAPFSRSFDMTGTIHRILNQDGGKNDNTITPYLSRVYTV
jgi:hypothetical protein